MIQYSRTFALQVQTPWNQAHAPLLVESFPSFNTSQNIIFQKPSYIKIDQVQVGQNPLSYYNSIMNLNTTSLPLVGQQTSEKEKLRKQWAKKFKEKIGHLFASDVTQFYRQ